jgi:cobalt-zinc-cadmium resistance protein CzcA
MVRKLIEWAVNNPLVVLLLLVGLVGFGGYAFANVNVEAYPDPAPAIVEVLAQWPGASAEEMERQVTIPLEITLAGMPGLKETRSRSLFGLTYLRNQFEYGVEFDKAKQEVINRLQFTPPLPPGVTPVLSPATTTGEIYRYTLRSPKNALGQDIYTLNDLKLLQDWTLEREFKRVPRIMDVTGAGGTVKRYEIHPDPNRLKRFGITLPQLQNAVANSNANVGGDYIPQGRTTLVVRNLGVIGGGKDPMEIAFGMKTPEEAAAYLRAEDEERVREMRQIIITSVNNVPIRVDDVVEGGPIGTGKASTYTGMGRSRQGVVVGHLTRLGQVMMNRPTNRMNTSWVHEDEVVQGIVLLRKNQESLPALIDVKKKVKDLNPRIDPKTGKEVYSGRMLPGVKIEPYYDRTDLINVTTHTVEHNLIMGMVLVTVILLMFLSNVRSALIVAINIPLALLFAFSMLFLRGKSANLLSIGAVDFGIIVDSSVIMVENIYRHLSSGEYQNLPLKDRIIRASHEVERSLFFSTAIMVCAFLPLFTMQGPEGQIFGPMADTYAFALGGALLLALTVAPVLCLLFFRNLQPSQDNFMVRMLKRSYLRQLRVCLHHRWLTLGFFALLLVITVVFLVPQLGREFMPELEEGNLWIRGTFPVNVSLEGVAAQVRTAQDIMTSYPEVELVVAQLGRPDDGTDPNGYNNIEFFVPLRPQRDWPAVKGPGGKKKKRKKPELIAAMKRELNSKIIGVDWNFSQNIRDNVMESLSGVKGDNAVKIFGPDLQKLEELAEKVKQRLEQVRGIGKEDVGVFRIMGQSDLVFRVDREKCKRWGVQVADVNNVIETAVRGKAMTQMIEGEKLLDITLRWPQKDRADPTAILDIPVDVISNQVPTTLAPAAQQTPLTGPATGISPQGTSQAMPSLFGSTANTTYNSFLPRLTLRDLVSPVGANGRVDRNGQWVRPGASIITREQGRRFIGVKFSVRDRDLASTVADAQEATADLFTDPSYEAHWGGEFEEMEAAEGRLLVIIPLSLGLIFILLYMAFHSLLDALVVLSNVAALSLGGVWALLLTGTNFSISAAVGFVSIFGVAIMDGLLAVSYFNQLRLQGMPVEEAIIHGAEKRVRPIMMTALTAIFGLLPAAISTDIGAQTQQPLAIVVVGGMFTTLFLTRYLMPVLYSFYGHREPPAAGGRMAH